MNGLFGMLFGLAATLWLMPYLLVGAGFVLVVWLIHRAVRRSADRELAARLELRDVAERADRQHQEFFAGDPHGLYGDATPAVLDYQEAMR